MERERQRKREQERRRREAQVIDGFKFCPHDFIMQEFDLNTLYMSQCTVIQYFVFFSEKYYCLAPDGSKSMIFATIDHDPQKFDVIF